MELIINEKTYDVAAESEERLLTVLREYVGLTGTKYGCGEGACGACTVLLNDTAVRSCSVTAESARGKRITTIEGLAKDDGLHPVQEAFLQEDVFQCGYCASGMVMSAVALLSKTDNPTRDDVVRGMQGNICRCGTYPRMLGAIEKAIELKKS